MNSKVRRFNPKGIEAFEVLLTDFRATQQIDMIQLNSVLYDTVLSDELDCEIEIAETFSKLEIAKELSAKLELESNKNLYYDKGLWTWLSAFLLDLLVPYKRKSADRDFKEKALYVLETDTWNRYYRHLLAFSCWIYSELKSKGQIFLRGSIHERGEIVEQLASVQEIQRNKAIVEAATILYYDSAKDDIIRGAASKNQGGTARRFREVIQQFKMTFDLNSMDGNQIVKIMPPEFDKWTKAS